MMRYKVKKVVITMDDFGSFDKIVVLWDDFGSVRATFKVVKDCFGELDFTHSCLDGVIQQVCAYGSYISENDKKEFFPKIKNWSR